MIVLDTSVLVEGLGAGGLLRDALRDAIRERDRMAVPSLVLFEWLRGPRTEAELRAQEALFPAVDALPFGAREAEIAAGLYRSLPRARGRDVDLAIAACAIAWEGTVWTANPKDFEDIPALPVRAA